METVFSLVYFDGKQSPTEPMGAMYGPFLFDSKEEAEGELKTFLKYHLTHNVSDIMAEYFTEDEALIELCGTASVEAKEAFGKVLAQAEHSVDDLVNTFSEFVQDEDDCLFQYKIVEQPKRSLLDALSIAKVVSINDIRVPQYKLNKERTTALLNETAFHARVHDNGAGHEWTFCHGRMRNAEYKPELKGWEVDKGVVIRLDVMSGLI